MRGLQVVQTGKDHRRAQRADTAVDHGASEDRVYVRSQLAGGCKMPLIQPEIYYALTMLQGVLTIGLPVFAFIYLFRPR